MSRFAQRLLRSSLVWKLAGLTTATAINATTGQWLTRPEYLSACRDQMAQWSAYFPPGCTVIDFGSGVGGNLIAVAPSIGHGTGLDINRLFSARSRRIARGAGVTNLTFLTLGRPEDWAALAPVDRVFSVGVFERIHKPEARSLVVRLTNLLRPDGKMVLTFLTERAQQTHFVARLGADAYVYWSPEELTRFFATLGLGVEASGRWGPASRREGTGTLEVHDYYVLARP